MKSTMLGASWEFWLGASACLLPTLHAQIAPKLSIHMQSGYAEITVTGTVNTAYEIQASTWLPATSGWWTLTNVILPTSPWVYIDGGSPMARTGFYRVVGPNTPPDTNAPINMVLIPAGSFTMGDTFNEGESDELPLHTVYVSAFYMDRYEVTKALWDEVMTWATAHGYSLDSAGLGEAANHPVHQVNWYDVVKWCNARSEKEGRVPAYYTDAARTTVYRTRQVNVQNDWVKWDRGYRLPTEAEWEKAARGGASGHRFPWSNVDTITHNQANYYSSTSYSYDISSTRGYHPNYQTDGNTYTSPVGSFAANGYGLYDMAGNVLEWCWDWWDSSHYSSSPGSDPRGPNSGSYHVDRGGSWYGRAVNCRVAYRSGDPPHSGINTRGFRSVLPPSQ